MKQIYYTQCPIGYGLGASNGFQIKRLGPGYPVSGDFRHFSMRAFVAGTRVMAPATLRYRRGEGGAAEIAWLTPRSHEYETERGAWGRPGGHFAHGLQLDDDELAALGDWPAGLFDQAFWARTDREPSRGQPPAPLELSAASLGRPPTFASVAPMAAGEDVDRLARLLTALAAAAREGRTLFLIDEPARLGDRMALLTFAFPPPWRTALTFSTYHDRPEDLPGFRLQGTIPSARPNRPALLAHGFVADLAGAGTIEPRVAAAGWARTLAGWLVRHGEDDQADWEATRRRALRARDPEEPGSIWSDAWLRRMFGLPGMIREGPPVPAVAAEWSELGDWTTWAGRAGLAEEWVRARPPSWWRTAADTCKAEGPEARVALLRQLGLPESWRGDGRASAWGEVVALWVRSTADDVRLATTAKALTAAPAADRPSCAGALIRGLPPDAAAATVSWLEAQPAWDRSILLPLKAHGSVTSAITSHEPAALRAVLAEAIAMPDVLPAVLDALAAEARDLPGAVPIAAGHLAEALDAADPRAVTEAHRWALNPAHAADRWLAPYWLRLFAAPLNHDAWRALVQRTTPELHTALTRALLDVATSPRASFEAFRWGIEERVLALAEAERPHDPSWPGAYLDRLPSGLDLLERLFAKAYRPLGLRKWLEQARGRGELSSVQGARLDDCVRYARVLMSGEARALLKVKLPDVPAEERGALLGQILGRLGDGSDDSLNLALDSVRAAWPDGFNPGVPGLVGLSHALAEPLLAERTYPDLWIERLGRVLDRLGLASGPDGGFEPDGLAAEVVAVTVRRAGAVFDPWRLRQALLQDDAAWRALAADVRDDLRGQSIDASLKLLDEWDQKLVKGTHTARFFEVWLNTCDPFQLTAAVCERAADLKNLDLPWWDSPRFAGARNDLRERFARLSPMAPLRAGLLAIVRKWLLPSKPAPRRDEPDDFAPLDPDGPPAARDRREEATRGPVSTRGMIRWRCLEALTIFAHPDETPDARWERVKAWTRELPLGQIELADRHRFVGWVIVGFPRLDPDRIARLASWLYRSGINDPECPWLNRWYDDLAAVGPVDGALRIERAALVGELRSELRNVIRDAAERTRKTGNTGSP